MGCLFCANSPDVTNRLIGQLFSWSYYEWNESPLTVFFYLGQ